MSTTGKDPSEALIAGIKTVLSGNVTVSGVTYSVYDTLNRGATNRTYVLIGPYIDTENGSKDSFVYEGSITVETVDESQTMNVSRSTAQQINNKVRSLLEPAKGTTFSVTGYTLVVFRHAGSTQLRELGSDKRERIRIIDIYEFVIQ